MSAYIVAMVSIDDPETYKKYTAKTPALIARHGGKFIARGSDVTTLEGEVFTDRMVIIEFPSQQALNRGRVAMNSATVLRRRRMYASTLRRPTSSNTSSERGYSQIMCAPLFGRLMRHIFHAARMWNPSSRASRAGLITQDSLPYRITLWTTAR